MTRREMERHTRRTFLKGLGILGLTGPLALAGTRSSRAPLGSRVARARHPVLVTVFLRGGADALSLVVPYQEGNYHASRRGGVALPKPGEKGGVIDLDGTFGLHPGLAALKPFWDDGKLALVHAVGHPAASRSHFEEQDVWETALLENAPGSTGWINRHLALVEKHGPVRAVCLGEGLVRSLRGAVPAQAVSDLSDLTLSGGQLPADRTRALLRALYGEGEDGVSRAGQEALEAVKVLSRIDPKAYVPAKGAAYPKGSFGRRLRQAAQLLKADVGLEVVACDLGGWDTHKQQAQRLAGLTRQFAEGLSAFAHDLGPEMDRVVVLAVSEFGRTLKSNNTGGTDHGRAGVVWVLGGGARGGRVHGPWPGTDKRSLYKGRELDYRTDFRSMLTEVLAGPLGNARAAEVLPGFKPAPVGVFATTG